MQKFQDQKSTELLLVYYSDEYLITYNVPPIWYTHCHSFHNARNFLAKDNHYKRGGLKIISTYCVIHNILSPPYENPTRYTLLNIETIKILCIGYIG